jgi:hypothetical protein
VVLLLQAQAVLAVRGTGLTLIRELVRGILERVAAVLGDIREQAAPALVMVVMVLLLLTMFKQQVGLAVVVVVAMVGFLLVEMLILVVVVELEF